MSNLSLEVKNQRWETAKKIVEYIKTYCINHNCKMMYEDVIYSPDDLIIDSSSIVLKNNNSETVFYTNDINCEPGPCNTTKEWYEISGLLDMKFIISFNAPSFNKINELI